MSRELWLDREAVCQLTGWTQRTVERKSTAGELQSRESAKRGRNGRAQREYAASSLPGEIQMKLTQQRLQAAYIPQTEMAVVPHPETHADRQISLFITPPAVSEDQRLALTPRQNEVAQQRLAAISPLLEFRKKSNGYKPCVYLQGGREIRDLDSLAAYLAGQHNVSHRTLWRWYARFKESGYSALADSVRSDKGTSRFFAERPSVAEFVQAKYLVERLSIQRVHECLCEKLKEEAPSYETLRLYLHALPAPITTMAREGERAFHERCAPFLITDFKTVRANQIWVSDHVKHDVWVRNDCFPGFPVDAAIRPWMTAIIDMRTRKCMAAVWAATPSSHTISSALRMAIQAWGVPETFYIDNGKDFEAIGRIDFSPEASGVLARLGIESQYCIPKHPQSKLIERWFGTVHERFDKLWNPFYCGSSPATRSDDCELALREHEKLAKQRKAHLSPLPAASEFVSMCRTWIEEYNSSHPHSGRGMNGKAPDELFEELLPIEKRHLLDNPRSLDELFWQRDRRRVTEGGCVQIFNQRYEPADAESSARLFMEIERDIFIACDPNNLGEAIALDLDGRYLGMLRCQKMTARGPVSRDDVRAGMRKQRAVRRVVRDYLGFISQGYGSELDKLRARTPRPAQREDRKLAPEPEVLPPTRRAKAVGANHIEDIVNQFREAD